MPTLRILCVVFDGCEDVEHAIIELIDEDIKRLAIRRKAFLEAKHDDPKLFDHRYESDDATFYSALSFKNAELEGDTYEASEYLEDANTLMLAEKDEISEKDSQTVDMSLSMLVVETGGVFWSGTPEGENADVQTELVSWEHLFEGRL